MGGAVWQLAAEHVMRSKTMMRSSGILQSRGSQEDESGSDSEDASSNGSQDEQDPENREQRVAVACEDGCVRIFAVSDKQLGMIYHQSFPRVKGEISLAHLPSARTLFDCEDCTLMSELL
jgi:U3 small nucleolar RNA-associated protein 4